MKKATLIASIVALIAAGAVCYAQAPAAQQPPVEEVTVTAAGLYGDWKMVLPELPGFDKPVVGDFCNFQKHGGGVAIVCADDFLQEVPEVTLNGDKLRLRWGGALDHTIYDATLLANGSFEGELVQAEMGIVKHRFRANMERVFESSTNAAPPATLAVLSTYFDDLTSRSVRENYYEAGVYKVMKQAVAAGAYAHAGFTAKYFGSILHANDQGQTYPDVFKVSNAANAQQWCLVRVDAAGLADVRCRGIP